MKKILVALLVLAILASGACAPKPNEGKTGESTSAPSNPTAANETAAPATPKADDGANELFDAYFRVPLHEIYIDVPSSFKHYNNAMTEIFQDQNFKYLSITNDDGIVFDSDEEAYSEIFEGFCLYTENLNTVLDTDFTIDEKITVNGIEARHYVGSLLCETDSEPSKQFIAGYTFVFDGVPINIAGVALEESADEALKNEIIELVDTMMKSVRTQP